MSQKAARRGVPNEEKEKTDTPVKDMKKKMAANAEKEKAVAEKSETQAEKATEKLEKTPKQADKATEKLEKTPKQADKATEKLEKTPKQADKGTDKQEKTAKQPEKTVEKTTDKSKEEKKAEKHDKTEKNEKPVEKKAEQAEKSKEDGKGDKSKKQKQNGHNGTEPSANGEAELNGNGTEAELNGRVSAESEDDLYVHEDDEIFPELTYDDSEDSFEPPTPDGAPSRSRTRRSQAKVTRTPETPRPTSAKHDAADDSKESKVLKLKEDSLATDRKLRSADSPKPESKKDKKEEANEKKEESKEKEGKGEEESQKEKDKMEVEVVIEVEGEAEGGRKTDTNFSKSRVKVSPYRRSMRLADQTTSSVTANYTGNNTTMEMDITETSSFISEEPSLDDSYLSGLRSIRGRRSYKPLKEMSLRSLANQSSRANTSVSEHPSRPTGTVVGRKRKPDSDDTIELAVDANDTDVLHGKRMRLLDRIAHPFRRTVHSAGVARRAADIVGINTDLPLTAPVSSPDTFDPETLKPASAPISATPPAPTDRDNKRCAIM